MCYKAFPMKKYYMEGSRRVYITIVAWRIVRVNPPRPRPAKYRHMGCYRDSRKRILKIHIHGSRISVDSCFRYCKRRGYSLMGLQASNHCFCGKRFTRKPRRISIRRCNLKCVGNRRQICGGHWAMNVYRIGRATRRR